MSQFSYSAWDMKISVNYKSVHTVASGQGNIEVTLLRLGLLHLCREIREWLSVKDCMPHGNLRTYVHNIACCKPSGTMAAA